MSVCLWLWGGTPPPEPWEEGCPHPGVTLFLSGPFWSAGSWGSQAGWGTKQDDPSSSAYRGDGKERSEPQPQGLPRLLLASEKGEDLGPAEPSQSSDSRALRSPWNGRGWVVRGQS